MGITDNTSEKQPSLESVTDSIENLYRVIHIVIHRLNEANELILGAMKSYPQFFDAPTTKKEIIEKEENQSIRPPLHRQIGMDPGDRGSVRGKEAIRDEERSEQAADLVERLVFKAVQGGNEEVMVRIYLSKFLEVARQGMLATGARLTPTKSLALLKRAYQYRSYALLAAIEIWVDAHAATKPAAYCFGIAARHHRATDGEIDAVLERHRAIQGKLGGGLFDEVSGK